MKILVVEDDEAIAKTLATALTKEHYVVNIAVDGQAGWELATICSCDLIILDVILPKVDGITLCRQLRREGYQMPILLLTAKNSRSDKIMGLDAGADDYVVKPFDLQELTARIRALLRRGHSALPPVLHWGSLRLDSNYCEVTYANQPLHLTPKEYGLLLLFLRNTQRVFSRGAIIENLWAFDDPPAEDTIKSHIKSLRQKLKAAGAPKDFIETVYGIGYRLKPLPSEPASHTTTAQANWTEQQIVLALAQCREEFHAQMSDRISVLDHMVVALMHGKFENALLSLALQEAHKLAGTLGTLGYDLGSQIAKEIEQILRTNLTALSQTQSLRLCQLVMQLHQELRLTPILSITEQLRAPCQ